MTVRSALLLNESPLVIVPSLAVAIGLPEAVLVQQVHYWLERSNHHIEGRVWVYNSLPAWCEQFPFWSKSTVKRTISRLEKSGILISGQFNRDTRDKTKWYTIDYERLEELANQSEIPSGQNDPMVGSNCTDGSGQNEPISSGQNDPSITIDYSSDYTENQSVSEPDTSKETPSVEPDLPPDDPEKQLDSEMSEWMFERVQAVSPYVKKPNWRSWADTIRLMRERDGIERSVIARAFAWANKHSFWRTNVLSPGALRRNFDKIHAQYLESSGGSSGPVNGHAKQCDRQAQKQQVRKRLRDINDTNW